MKKTILFIGHDANRAGAQILLLRLLRLLKQKTDFEFQILLKHGGILKEEFAKVATTYLWNQPRRPILERMKNIVTEANTLELYRDEVRERLHQSSIGLIVSNTLTNGDILPQLLYLDCPIVSYAHELEMGINMYTTPENFQKTLIHTDFYWVCAKAITRFLKEEYGVSTNSSEWLPSLPPQKKSQMIAPHLVREKLGISNQKYLIGGIGSPDLRKGIDIFVEMAAYFEQHNPDIAMAWIGASDEPFRHKLNKQQLPKNLSFVSSTPDAISYLNTFDAFFLSSREEVYPLVAMEAAMLKKPIVYFSQAGGSAEFLETDAGIKVPYLDLEKSIDAFLFLKQTPEKARALGERAYQKLEEWHNQEMILKKLIYLIQNHL